MLDDRIRELCAQLLRAEDPAVIETVAAHLHLALEEYVRAAHQSAAKQVSLFFDLPDRR